MTKAEIRTAFLAILKNTACTNALADAFIEQGLARSQRLLKLPAQEAVSVGVVGDDWTGFEIPSDYLKGLNLYYDQRSLKKISLGEYLEQSYGGGTTAAPKVYCRSRGKLLVGPVPTEGTTLKLHYIAEFEEFSGDSDETAMSSIAPDLFIYGGLTYAADHFEDTRATRFEQRYLQIVGDLQQMADDDELSGEATMALPEAYKFPTEDY